MRAPWLLVALSACTGFAVSDEVPTEEAAQAVATPNLRAPVVTGPGVGHPSTWGAARGTFGLSWDGLLVLGTKSEPLPPLPNGTLRVQDGLFAHVYRPDLVRPAADGRLDFSQALSPMHLMEPSWWGDPPRPVGHCTATGCDTAPLYNPVANMCLIHGVALAPAPAEFVAQRYPGVDLRENPYPSNEHGLPVLDGRGTHRTYVFEAVVGEFGASICRLMPQSHQDGLGRRYGFVVVSMRTPRGAVRPVPDEVVKAEFITPFEALTYTPNEAFSVAPIGPEARGSRTMVGIEPSVSRDGRLLVFQDFGHIRVSYRRGDLYWSEPVELSAFHAVTAAATLEGKPFGERYAIARAPLRTPVGTVLSTQDPTLGAYPWVDQDGALVTFSAMLGRTWGTLFGFTVDDDGRRSKQVAVGAATGWQMKVLDTPLNSQLGSSPRVVAGSAGRYDTAWDPLIHAAPAARDVFPYRPERGLLGLFSSSSTSTGAALYYDEVSFRDFEDGHVLLAASMTEPFGAPVGGEWLPFVDRTQDTSPYRRPVLLEGNVFPAAITHSDSPQGIVGQAVACLAGGRVRVPAAPELDTWNRLTVEAWVRRTTRNQPLGVFRGDGFAVELRDDGTVVARIGAVTLTAPMSADTQWHHFALAMDPARGTALLYADGRPVARRTGAPYAVTRLGGALRFCEPLPLAAPSNGALAYVDEVVVSDVVRSESEVRTSALRFQPRSSAGLGPVALPAGLVPREVFVPTSNPLTAAKIELGRHLFFDTNLSANRAVACATCHDPSRGFSDGRARSFGLAEVRRRSPSIVNLALRHDGDGFLWDGRAATLEQQVLEPFTTKAEHGLADTRALLARVSERPIYATLYRRAFGSATPTSQTTALALASFVRSLLAGDAPVDRFEAGDRTALTDEQIRGRELFFGKARCASCHAGSTYSDGRVHRIGSHVPSIGDFGRAEVSERLNDVNRFVTPSLRDLSRASFLLHDGLITTSQLDLLVQNYANGGNSKTPLAPDPEVMALRLSAIERAQLVDFVVNGLNSSDYPRPVSPF